MTEFENKFAKELLIKFTIIEGITFEIDYVT
ncbi:MAG: hypothetical protein JG776_1795 [Caloramator sp.]|jgi:hypothetical protein|nr:hypothetical protein [Caloramator sp.]